MKKTIVLNQVSGKEEALGSKGNYVHWAPEANPKDDCGVLFIPGKGELGPRDGSQISKVWRHGLPAMAKCDHIYNEDGTIKYQGNPNGIEFPFHIIAVQEENGYWGTVRVFPAFMKLKLKLRELHVTGLSLGGMATWDCVEADYVDCIDHASVVCGRGISSDQMWDDEEYYDRWNKESPAKNFPPLIAWHGDGDKTVSYHAGKNALNAYNAAYNRLIDKDDSRPDPGTFVTYEGAGHSIWNRVYQGGDWQAWMDAKGFFKDKPTSMGFTQEDLDTAAAVAVAAREAEIHQNIFKRN